ncbi:hypothetical protein GQ53DRAFT_881413 [Thozetella sp. PMI_491]|nr:hypothetical protein GQ53DRAFT_881413 [Thozetella sp. PMI_491]
MELPDMPSTLPADSAYDFRLNGVQVWECNAQGFGTPADYCCESAAEKTRCCATATALFSLPSASQGNALPIQTVTSEETTAKAASTSLATSPRSTASKSGTTSAATGATTAAPTTTKGTVGADSAPGVTAPSPTSQTKAVASTKASAGESNLPVPETSTSDDPSESTGAGSNGASTGFSTAAVVGIGIGASVASAIVVVSFVMFLLRRRARVDSDNMSYYGGPPGPVQAGIIPNRFAPDRDVWYDGQTRPRTSGLPSLDMAEIDSIRGVHMNRKGSPVVSELESQRPSPTAVKGGRKSRLFELPS